MTVTRTSPSTSSSDPVDGGSSASRPRSAGRAPIRSPIVLGLVGGAQAALGGLLCVLVPTVVVWTASPTTAAVWTQTIRVASAGWLLAHHGNISVDGGHLSLVPLGLSLVPVAWCWSAGRRLSEALSVVGPAGLPRQAVSALAAFTGGYAVLVGVVSVVTGTSVARPAASQAFVGAVLLAGGAGGAALVRGLRRRRTDGGTLCAHLGLRLPVPARHVLRAAAVALAAWVAAAAAVTVVALVLGWDRVAALREALAPGLVGGLGLTLLDLAYVPTAVVWSAAWIAGPGFSVGAQTAVSPGTTALGPLPAVPLLGALPEPGAMPFWAWAAVGLPVLAGALAGWRLRLAMPDASRVVAAGHCAAVAAAAGAGGVLLAWLASGAAGAGRLAHLGPTPWLVGLCLGVEVLAGCLLAALLPPWAAPGARATAPGLRDARRWLSHGARRLSGEVRRGRWSGAVRAGPRWRRRVEGRKARLRAQLSRRPNWVRSFRRRS